MRLTTELQALPADQSRYPHTKSDGRAGNWNPLRQRVVRPMLEGERSKSGPGAIQPEQAVKPFLLESS